MIDAIQIGKLLAEEVINQPGPCFYPGKFKPPHKGHFEAAKNLASRNYVQKVIILISSKVIEGITPEDSLQIWNMYLKAAPNPKIVVQIAAEESPIQAIIHYLQANPEIDPVYVAGGDDEVDDENYLKSLQDQFGDRVRTIKVQEKSGVISAPYVRNLLQTGNYEEFAETVPEAAFNRGAAPTIFKMLAPKTTPETNEPK
jgi:hypothetical protein